MEDDIESWKQIITPCFVDYPFGEPMQVRDSRGLLHREDGPAYVDNSEACWYLRGRRHGLRLLSDGRVEYFFMGVKIPSVVNPWMLDCATLYKVMEGFYESEVA